MNKMDLAFWMTVAGTVCWAVCFGWMHRISAKQNRVMDQLREQGQRTEKLSKIEHDLIKMEEMIAAVKENIESHSSPKTKRAA